MKLAQNIKKLIIETKKCKHTFNLFVRKYLTIIKEMFLRKLSMNGCVIIGYE